MSRCFETDGELIAYIAENVLTPGEVTEMLNCSRQNVADLVRRGKLHPIKSRERLQLFWRPEVAARVKP